MLLKWGSRLSELNDENSTYRHLNASGFGCRGRVFDNIFVERLWRSVKYEEVYLKDYQTPEEAYRGLEGYFEFYNTEERLHQASNYGTPQEAYQQGAGKYHSENAEHHLISA